MTRTQYATPAEDASDLAARAIAAETGEYDEPCDACPEAYAESGQPCFAHQPNERAARALWALALDYAMLAQADACRALGVTWEAAR